uniref:Alternative protein FAM21B n=1 Tax=Homo sapiens TaxID=9606 RepID=L8EA22_HUMAN|nr:alternative protein FAM21B [Homo sapiens]
MMISFSLLNQNQQRKQIPFLSWKMRMTSLQIRKSRRMRQNPIVSRMSY